MNGYPRLFFIDFTATKVFFDFAIIINGNCHTNGN